MKVTNTPQVIRRNLFSCQVCVPKDWTDEQVIELAEKEFPSGVENGWRIRKDPELLAGDPERNPCAFDPENYIHITLDA